MVGAWCVLLEVLLRRRDSKPRASEGTRGKALHSGKAEAGGWSGGVVFRSSLDPLRCRGSGMYSKGYFCQEVER